MISALDCADEEHHRVMQGIFEKADDVNRKQKRIKEIVRQRKREDEDEDANRKRKDMQQFLLTTNQFMQGWDKRILEETNEAVESVGCEIYHNYEAHAQHEHVPTHFVQKHHNHSDCGVDYEENNVNMNNETDLEMSAIKHQDDNNMTHYTNHFEFRNKDSKILQDPLTPHNNKINNLQKTKKLSQINNIVSEE